MSLKSLHEIIPIRFITEPIPPLLTRHARAPRLTFEILTLRVRLILRWGRPFASNLNICSLSVTDLNSCGVKISSRKRRASFIVRSLINAEQISIVCLLFLSICTGTTVRRWHLKINPTALLFLHFSRGPGGVSEIVDNL